MPTYQLTSPKTGRTYGVQSEAELPDDDIDALVNDLDFEAAREAGVQPGVDPAVLQQGPVGTFFGSFPNTFSKIGSETIGGVGRMLDKASESLSQATGLPKGGDMFQRMADYGDELSTSADLTFPTNPQNPVAGTIGSGAAQGLSLLAGGLAGKALTGSNVAMTAVPAASGFLSGANQGIQTAEQIGVQSPLAQLGTGMAFGGLEVLTERLGGIGSKAGTEALTRAVRQTAGQMLRSSGRAVGSEALEEVLAGRSQAALTRLIASEDPDNPGFTRTGVNLDALASEIVNLEAMKLEALGGAAGGTVFAGVQALANRQLPNDPTTSPNQTPSPTQPPAPSQPGAAAPMGAGAPGPAAVSPLIGIAQRGGAVDVTLPEDTGELTAEEVEDLETLRQGDLETGRRQPILQGVPDRPQRTARFQESSINEEPIMEGDAITDLRIPRSPQAIAESQRIEAERQQQIATMRMLDARAQGMPLIPDSPSGSRDILDFANENPIYLPPGFSEERNLPEYEKLKEAKLPPYWRQFVASSKRGGNPSDVAQRAFDAGFIDAPTADAYLEAVRSGIEGRQQYRVQFKQREQALAEEETRVVDFEKTQDKLARKRKEPATEVSFEDIVPGDEMTIDGEAAVVRNVEYNEDGYLTNVVIEDGKRFGLMQFDPQTRGGILVDEYLPRAARPAVAADEFAPADAPSPSLPVSPSPSLDSLLQGTESTRPRNRGETTRPQNADPLGELQRAKLAGEANQAQGRLAMPSSPKQWALQLPDESKAEFSEGQMSADHYGDDPYVYRDQWVKPSDLISNLKLEGLTYEQVVRMPSTQQYIELYKQGSLPPPITVVFNIPEGKLKSNNRRRVVAAIEAGITQIPARVEIGRASELSPTASVTQGPAPTANKTAQQAGDAGSSPAAGASLQEFQPQSRASRAEDTPTSISARIAPGTEISTAAATPSAANQRTERHRLGFAEIGTATEVSQVEISAPEDVPLRQAAQAGVRVWDQFWGPLTKAVRIVKGSGKPRENGLFVPTSGTANEIQLNRHEKGMDEDVLTVVHELAHHADSTGLTTAESEAPKAGTPMAKLMDQLNTKLPTAQKLNRAVAYWEKNRPKNAFERKIAEYVKYLAQPAERFARAVEQATRHLSQGRVLAAQPRSPYAAGYLTLAEIESIIPLLHDVLGTGSQTTRTQDRLPRSGATAAPSDARAVGAAYRGSTGADSGGSQRVSRQSASPVGEAPNETQSRFASPNAADNLYEVEPVEVAQTAGRAWLDQTPVETALQHFEQAVVPAGMTQARMFYAHAELIKRLVKTADNGTEIQRLQGNVLLERAARAWHGKESQEWGRAGKARAVASGELETISGILAVKELLVDRAKKVIDQRFEGGTEGAVKKVKDIATTAGEQTATDLAEQLEDTTSTATDPRIADLEARLKDLREPMQNREAEADTTLKETSSTWQKILNVLNSASQRKSKLLNGVKGRVASMRKAAMERKAKRRAEGRLSANPIEDFADDVIIGTSLLAEGIVEFSNWSQALVREIGARSAADLRRLYAEASKEYLSLLEAEKARPATSLQSKHPNLKKMLDALRKKMFPGMTWADIFTQLPETQKARQREIYRRLMLDERLRNLTAEERLALTNELDKAWQRERRKVFMRELEKAGVLGEAKPKDREKVKAAAPRLLRLMNLGMLNSEMFREALAKEYGLNMIDAAAAADLRALGERIQKAPEGLPRRKLEQQLVERLQKLSGYTLWQVMDSWWTASVLSGWRTQVDIGLSIANGIEDIGLGSIVAALRSGNKDVAVRGLAALFGRIPSAFMEAVNHVATGNKAMMRSFELEVKQAMEGGNLLASDVGRQMWDRGGWRKALGGFMVFYGRLMTALDHVNSASTREGAKALALARHPDLYQKALRISDADRAAARQQARLELTGGAVPATQQERIEENARMREILEQGIPAEMLAEATEVGRAAALQGEPTGLGGALLDAVLSAVFVVNRKAQDLANRPNPDRLTRQGAAITAAMVPMARAITGTKFARTVAHSINRTASYVPGFGAYAVGQQGRTGAFGDILAAKQVIGTLVGIALYLAFDDDEDEKGIEDSWKDKTPQQKAQLYAQGKQPFTIWTRDEQGRVRNWNYQQWGIAGIVNTVAAMLKQKGSEAGTLNVLMSSITQGAMSFTDKAQLQGLQTVFGENFRSTDPASGVASSLNKWAAQTVGGMVPRLYKDIEMVYNPELHQMNEWWQKWAKEMPMGRKLSSGKRIDILGQDITLDRGPLSRVTQLGTADPIYRTLGRLNERDVWLPDPSQGVRVVKFSNGTRRNMNPQEKDRYQRLTGAAYRAYLEKEGAALLQMSPEDAQEAVSKATARLRSTAAYQATH